MPVATQHVREFVRARSIPRYKASGGARGLLEQFQGWSLIPLLLWLGMWANLNSGFWDIVIPTSISEWQLLIRAVVPFVALPVSMILLCASKNKLPIGKASPNLFLLIYGAISTVATVYSPMPEYSIYWSINFLATILCTWSLVRNESPRTSARHTLEATWAICFVGFMALAYLGRGSLFSGSSGDMAYGISGELNDLSRSSGVGRWAAIPGLVFLFRALIPGRTLIRIAYLCASLFCMYVVYRVQSRGAVFGVLGALVFAVLVNKRFHRPLAVALVWILLAAVSFQSVTGDSGVGTFGHSFSKYIRRGQSSEEFRSMTGRTRAYDHGLTAFWDSPFIGMGQWTDRLHPKIQEHIHNSFLQSLLNGGMIGALFYLCSWVAGWVLFFKLRSRRFELKAIDQQRLTEAGMIMAFFTLRAIPETTTASFSVDLVVMVVVYCYLDALGCWLLRLPAVGGRVRSSPRQIEGLV